MSEVAAALLLIAAGVAAGAVGSAGGITSLISYPALLIAGVPPLPASVANLVAAIACWPGSALSSRRELGNIRVRWVPVLSVVAIGAVIGSVLLIVTPPGLFERVVPFLVLIGSAALVGQPWLTARVDRLPGTPIVLGMSAMAAVSVYGGYFGAGSGILLLATLLIFVEQRLPEANAIKNMLIGAGTTVSALVFVIAGSVEWAAVGPLAVGLFVGSTGGPVIARRVPATPLRWCVATLGVVLAVVLWAMG